jgi:ketopantoate reductase
MNIAIIGAGAIGTAIAVGTSCARRKVVLVARGKMLVQMRSKALRLIGEDGFREARVPVLAANEIVEPIDVAILCVKTYDLAEASVSLNSTESLGEVYARCFAC